MMEILNMIKPLKPQFLWEHDHPLIWVHLTRTSSIDHTYDMGRNGWPVEGDPQGTLRISHVWVASTSPWEASGMAV